jgi:glycosyltransferase involved in cell wall biosynthesis
VAIKVIHIITGLGDGGAEGVLFRLIKATSGQCNTTVISLTDMGKYGPRISDIGVEVVCLGMDRGRVNIKALYSMYKVLKSFKPDVVQTWMHHADLLGGVLAYFLGVRSIFWNIRTAELHSKKIKIGTRMVIKSCAILSSHIPKKIVSCSNRAINVSLSLGYVNNFQLIPNGCDTKLFTQSDSYRKKIRSNWNVSDSCFVLGMVARYDPQKDHCNLIKSLSIVIKNIKNIKLILVGANMDNSNKILVKAIHDEKITEKVILLGQQKNIPEIMNGLDVHVLSSLYGEAFPNVLTEAMSCGVPCISTDIGDALEIIDECGWIAKAGSFSQLSSAIIQAHQMRIKSPLEWGELKLKCINRVETNYKVSTMADKYLSLWHIKSKNKNGV